MLPLLILPKGVCGYLRHLLEPDHILAKANNSRSLSRIFRGHSRDASSSTRCRSLDTCCPRHIHHFGLLPFRKKVQPKGGHTFCAYSCYRFCIVVCHLGGALCQNEQWNLWVSVSFTVCYALSAQWFPYIVPYPFLTESNFTTRIGIYAGATIMAFAFFRLINNLHHWIPAS